MRVIPTWVWLAVGAALVGVIGLQQVRIANLNTTVAARETTIAERDTTLARVNEAAAKARAAWAAEREQLQSQHAAQQQEANDGFRKEIQGVQQRAAAQDAVVQQLRADNGRLRNQVRGYAAVTRTEGESDTALASRATHRLAVVGVLLDEGVQLAAREAEVAAEGRRIVETRDAEVKLLLDQIKADRVACSPLVQEPIQQDRSTPVSAPRPP